MSETQDEQEQEPDQEHEPAGLPDADDISDEKKAELDKEREERLDDDNRPDGAEVDNTERDFDDAAGMYTDNPDHSEDERPYVTEADMQEDA